MTSACLGYKSEDLLPVEKYKNTLGHWLTMGQNPSIVWRGSPSISPMACVCACVCVCVVGGPRGQVGNSVSHKGPEAPGFPPLPLLSVVSSLTQGAEL